MTTNTEAVPSLLPCPFCGTEQSIEEHPAHEHAFVNLPPHPGSFTIACPKCECGMIHETREGLIAAWNRRAPDKTSHPDDLAVDRFAAAPSKPLAVNLSQAQQLVELFGGDGEIEIALQMEDKGHAGAGLYAWFDEYPEEGSMFLDATRPVAGDTGAIAKLIEKHAALLDANPYAYFELAYTRYTGWMAWLTDRPAQGEPGTAEYAKSRKVIARGSGATATGACADALSLLDRVASSTGDQGES